MAIPAWWKVSGIWSDSFWIRDNPSSVRWWERQPISKVSLVSLRFRAKSLHILFSLKGNHKGHKPNTNNCTVLILSLQGNIEVADCDENGQLFLKIFFDTCFMTYLLNLRIEIPHYVIFLHNIWFTYYVIFFTKS